AKSPPELSVMVIEVIPLPTYPKNWDPKLPFTLSVMVSPLESVTVMLWTACWVGCAWKPKAATPESVMVTLDEPEKKATLPVYPQHHVLQLPLAVCIVAVG